MRLHFHHSERDGGGEEQAKSKNCSVMRQFLAMLVFYTDTYTQCTADCK